MTTPKRVPATRVCRHCLRRLSRLAFYRNAISAYGLRPECKRCTHIRRRVQKYNRA